MTDIAAHYNLDGTVNVTLCSDLTKTTTIPAGTQAEQDAAIQAFIAANSDGD